MKLHMVFYSNHKNQVGNCYAYLQRFVKIELHAVGEICEFVNHKKVNKKCNIIFFLIFQ